MEAPYSRIYAEINLDNVVKNVEAMAAGLPEGTRIIGVVKADGYGHGSVPVARAIDPYVWGYAVAALEEGVLLRRHGIKKPILVLGNAPARQLADFLRYDIRPSLFQLSKAKLLSELAVMQGVRAGIHLAVDTGMSRIGFQPTAQSIEEAAEIASLPGIETEGIFTHFARADEADQGATDRQYAAFMEFADELERRGVRIPIRHASNSAAALNRPGMGLDAVRAGISMYGIYPSDEIAWGLNLRPAMEIRSFIPCIREIAAGTPVSYGGTFTADRAMRIATISAGYADGYPRSLSGKGYVLIGGKRAPVLGRICMDQFMADVSGILQAQEEMPVTLVGSDGGETLSMEQLAQMAGGFRYEIPCVLGKRVPRVYIKDGRVAGTKDYQGDIYKDFL